LESRAESWRGGAVGTTPLEVDVLPSVMTRVVRLVE
jgi:hypothetical protein